MPSQSRSRASSTSSSSSFDDDYFFKTYVPLSNLPTPPLSSHSSGASRPTSPECLFPPGEALDPRFLGPAMHLTNLIPAAASLTTPSVALAHVLLTRAALPLETIALAVCILDSLNSRFALSWRQSCPLNTPLHPFSTTLQIPHIDSIHPELLILSALILAVKFVDDDQEETLTYALDWGKGMWSCEQINYSQRSILENLGYHLLPLWRESVITGALEDMERVRQQFEKAEEAKTLYPAAEPGIWDSDWEADAAFGSFENGKMSTGKAVLGVGQQLTPAETPGAEKRGMGDMELETRMAFERSGESLSFVLADMMLDSFPRYVDPDLEALDF